MSVNNYPVKTEPVSAIDQAETLMLGLSPAVFAVVVLVTVGSILALAVWLIIYRRRTRLGSALGEDNLCFKSVKESFNI